MSLWIFKMSSCGSNAGMETTAPVVNAIVKAVFHSNLDISQMSPQIIHILRFFSGRLAAQIL